jgi:hypothetical protein
MCIKKIFLKSFTRPGLRTVGNAIKDVVYLKLGIHNALCHCHQPCHNAGNYQDCSFSSQEPKVKWKADGSKAFGCNDTEIEYGGRIGQGLDESDNLAQNSSKDPSLDYVQIHHHDWETEDGY